MARTYRVTLTTTVEVSGAYANVDSGWIRMAVENEIESYQPRRGVEFGHTEVATVVAVTEEI